MHVYGVSGGPAGTSVIAFLMKDDFSEEKWL